MSDFKDDKERIDYAAQKIVENSYRFGQEMKNLKAENKALMAVYEAAKSEPIIEQWNEGYCTIEETDQLYEAHDNLVAAIKEAEKVLGGRDE